MKTVFFLLLYCLSGPLAFAQTFRVNSLFSDHMVLQRDRPIRVFGSAPDGTQVQVRLEKNTAATKAREGKWEVELPAMAAGGPYKLEIESPEKISYSDVRIGDVWVCSGQSNMVVLLRLLPGFEKNRAAMANPDLRLFQVDRTPSTTPKSEVKRDKFFTSGWQSAEGRALDTFSSVGYYFGDTLQKALGIPVGLINASQGATRVEGWLDEQTLARIAPDEQLLADPNDRKNPMVFYNAMIAPIQRFPIRGVVWYQGESNAMDPSTYEERFRTLVQRWREQWKEPEMPFYWVQLSSFGMPGWDRTGESWAWLREAQAGVRSEPNTGMAVTIDLGDYSDIHPLRKKAVGERLAALVLRGEGQNIPAVGPRFKSAEIQGNKMIVHFTNGEGLHVREVVMNKNKGFEPMKDPEAIRVSADIISGFTIAGADGQFHPAQARIDGGTVVVSSEEVPEPTDIRYGWANFTTANLYNAAGFPAEPFRSDHLPIPPEIDAQATRLNAAMRSPSDKQP